MRCFTMEVVAVLLFGLLSPIRSQSQRCQTTNGDRGQCINIRECAPLRALLQLIQSNTAPPGSTENLRNAICAFSGSTPFVCCPLSSQTPPPTPPPSPTPSPPQPSTSGNLLPSRCGVRGLADRIISGEDAPLLAWPWMALLESVGPNGRISLVCGGVLISDRYVLTAAHCVHASTGFTVQNVRIGEHTITTNPDCRDGLCNDPFQRIRVGQVTIHENYGQPFGCSNCNDIALLRLSRPANLDTLFVQPICLPQNLERDLGFSRSEVNNKFGWVAGWGTTDPVKVQPSNVLQQVLLPFNDNVCGIDLRVFPNRNMAFCVGGEQQDTCRGDSGGPLVMGNVGDTKYYLVGIVSRGPRICGAQNTGGIYMNVNFFVPWILRNIQP